MTGCSGGSPRMRPRALDQVLFLFFQLRLLVNYEKIIFRAISEDKINRNSAQLTASTSIHAKRQIEILSVARMWHEGKTIHEVLHVPGITRTHICMYLCGIVCQTSPVAITALAKDCVLPIPTPYELIGHCPAPSPVRTYLVTRPLEMRKGGSSWLLPQQWSVLQVKQRQVGVSTWINSKGMECGHLTI